MKLNRQIALTLIIFCLLSCENTQESKSEKIINVVGEIFPNETIDDDNFKICNPQNEIIQYYAFSEKTFEGEKIAIEEEFTRKYEPSGIKDSGWIRIRFIVNCNGDAGRFRVSGMDLKYKNKTFHSSIVDQLMSITKNLKGWKAMEARGHKRDYYQYLLFKIENGQILEILP